MRWTFQLICLNETIGMKAAKFSFRLAKGAHEKQYHITMDVNELRRKLMQGSGNGWPGGRKGEALVGWSALTNTFAEWEKRAQMVQRTRMCLRVGFLIQETPEAGEFAPRVRTLSVLSEDTSPVPSIHTAA